MEGLTLWNWERDVFPLSWLKLLFLSIRTMPLFGEHFRCCYTAMTKILTPALEMLTTLLYNI